MYVLRIFLVGIFSFFCCSGVFAQSPSKEMESLTNRVTKIEGVLKTVLGQSVDMYPSYYAGGSLENIRDLPRNFKELEDRVDRLSGSSRYSGNSPSMEDLSKKCDELESKLSHLSGGSYRSTSLSDLSQRIERLESKMETEIYSLKNSVNELKRKIGSLESRVNSLEYKVR